MQKTQLIVFDIDHTLINGNLSKILLKQAIRHKPWLFFKAIPLIIYDFYLKKIKLPALLKKELKNNNYQKIDATVQKNFIQLYRKIVTLLHGFHIKNHGLQNVAEQTFTPAFLKEHLFTKGVAKVKAHLKEENTVIVFASGELEEIIQPFLQAFAKMIKYPLDKNNFFAVGTEKTTKGFDVCIGGGKVKRIFACLKTHGFNDLTINTAYSDNDLLKDFPLILAAQHKRIIINIKNNYYDLLPKELIKTFTFLPNWSKK